MKEKYKGIVKLLILLLILASIISLIEYGNHRKRESAKEKDADCKKWGYDGYYDYNCYKIIDYEQKEANYNLLKEERKNETNKKIIQSLNI